MFNSTKHHDKKRLSWGGEQSLIFLLLTIFLQAPAAWAQSASIDFNASYVCAGQDVSFTVSLYYEGSEPRHVDIYSAVGQLACTEIGPGNHHFPYYAEATYDINGDNFWVEVWFDGVKAEVNYIPIIRITGFDAFANGQYTWAVAVGQRADFKVSLNNYMGNGPDWAPGEFWFEDVDNQNGSWASKTWGSPSYESVWARGITPNPAFYIYVLDARIKSVTFTGADFAAVNKDSDGTPYAEPHYDSANPEYRPPVQLRRGSRPTMNLWFEVLPPEYPGSLYIKALNDLETPVAHSLACAGIAQYPNVQTSDALPNSVGYDPDLTMNWEYSVAGGEFYFAGDSTHKIYRTLNAPASQYPYHTAVDIACNIDPTTDATEILDRIWSRFSGRNCANAAGEPLLYWRTAQAGNTVANFLATKDGTCTAWTRLLKYCWDVHGIAANSELVSLTHYDPDSVRGFLVYANIPGQNGIPAHRSYLNHKVAIYDGHVYDPSYGMKYRLADYGSENAWLWQWENQHVEMFMYKYEPRFRVDNKLIRELDTARGQW